MTNAIDFLEDYLKGRGKMTKTEKLQKEIDKLMRKAVGSGWWTYQTNEILKLCKEAGLKFVPPEWKMDNLCYASDRDAGVRDATKQAMNSQVKPIEVE